MTLMAHAIFLDSNVFIQCKDIKDLPWGDVFNHADEILLLIPRGTAKEIDKFKSQGNTRRSKKARSASTHFDAILSNQGLFKINDEVTIRFTSRKELSKVPVSEGLDMDRNDDLILQELISYRVLHPSENAILLTDDIGLIASAIDYDVPYQRIPESWKLAPEPDDKDKQIQALTKRVNELESKSPEIEIVLTDSEGLPISFIEINHVCYPELSEDELERLTNIIVDANPIKKVNYNDSSINWIRSINEPPSESEINEYVNTTYPNWVKAVQNKFKGFHSLLSVQQFPSNFNVIVKNNGLVPADHASLELSMSDSFYLYRDDEDILTKISLELPQAPEAPKPKPKTSFMGVLAHERVLDNFIRPRLNNFPDLISMNEDINTFYWREQPKGMSKLWEKACKSFRHKSKPLEVIVPIVFNLDVKPKGGHLKCTLSAHNLTTPTELVIRIKVNYSIGNTADKILTLIL